MNLRPVPLRAIRTAAAPRPSARLASTAAITLTLLGCHHASPRPTTPVREGTSDYRRIDEPAGTRHYTLSPSQSWTPPIVVHNPAPVYPPDLVARELPPVDVVARLSVDKNGHVEAVYVQPDPDHPATPPAFAAAVRRAAAAWRFTPMTFENKTNHGDRPPTVIRTRKPFSLWFRFHFEIVDGRPSTSSQRHRIHPASS